MKFDVGDFSSPTKLCTYTNTDTHSHIRTYPSPLLAYDGSSYAHAPNRDKDDEDVGEETEFVKFTRRKAYPEGSADRKALAYCVNRVLSLV